MLEIVLKHRGIKVLREYQELREEGKMDEFFSKFGSDRRFRMLEEQGRLPAV